MEIEIRRCEVEDLNNVEGILTKAFKDAPHSGGNEGEIAIKLQESEAFIKDFNLIASADGKDIGYGILTKVKVGDKEALGLGPIGVLPEYQKNGIGSFLIESLHELARRRGYPLIVVLGDDNYYSRFDYKEAKNYDLTLPFDIDSKYFRVHILDSEKAKGLTGVVHYDKAFFE